MLVWITLTLLGANGGALLVELNPSSSRTAELERALQLQTVDGEAVLDSLTLMRRLTGLKQPRDSEPAGFSDMLAEADRLEARFDTAGANAMRVEILRSYDAAARVTPELLVATARASQNRAASAIYERQPEAARALAMESTRRFPEIEIDGDRHNPEVVALFRDARSTHARAATGRLKVTATSSGVVHADGRALGPVESERTFELPLGHYRIWIDTPEGLSLARTVVITEDSNQALTLDPTLEARLDLTPVSLRCDPTLCPDLLRRLRAAARVTTVIGVEASPHGLRAIELGGDDEVREIDPTVLVNVRGAPGESGDGFSALYLLPFGVGQAAQERYVEAGVYAAIQIGLGVWNLSATRDANTAIDNRASNIEELQDRQDLSAVLFYSSLLASVLESVIVWSVTD